MEIHNETPFADGLAIGLGPGRRPCLSVLVKGTFAMPAEPGTVALADEQRPVATEDEYYKGDVTGSVRIEADTVPYKPRTDVVVVGSAYAPGGDPVRQLDVSLRVGRRLHHAIRVFGDRAWVFPTRMAVVPRITDPVPFVEMPLIYERAFGGMDHAAHRWCSSNFIGRGFIGRKSRASVDRKPLPNLENPRDLIASWDDQPQPVGFGFYRKDWQPRASYVGAPEEPEEAGEPFGLPPGFQLDFFNGAHPNLQVPDYLAGDERVELRHCTPGGYRQFVLPGLQPKVTVHRYGGPGASGPADGRAPAASTTEAEGLAMRFDTLVLLPDEEQLYIVWRGHCPIQASDLSLDEFARIHIDVNGKRP